MVGKIGVHSPTAPKPKRKRLGWNEGSEVALLDLWPERLEELRRQRKNGQIYAEMANDLSKVGYTYSPRDVQVKLQNFKQRYKKEKATLNKSPSTWPHYARVHQILEGSKINMSTELKLECIDGTSIVSLSSSPPSTPLPAPSSPLLIPISPVASRTASALEPAEKTGLSNFQSAVLQKFESLSTVITEHLKESKKNEKELIEIEKKKADSLEKIAKDSEEIKNALISLLKKN